MKKLHFWGFIFLGLCVVYQSDAQAQEEFPCRERTQVAKSYMPFLEYLSRELKEEILEQILQCTTEDNPDASFVAGALYDNLQTSDGSENAFFFTQIAAEKGIAEAQRAMGIYFKNGKYVEKDEKKSFEWFTKAAAQGDDFSHYATGYFKMKGLGSNDIHDYTSAVQDFKNSSYSMATHWEALCTYFGLGVSKNKRKAESLLRNNETTSSTALLNALRRQDHDAFTLSFEEESLIGDYGANGSSIDPQEISKRYKGKLYEFDWGGYKSIDGYTQIKRVIDLDLSLEYNSNTGKFTYFALLPGTSFSGEAILQGNQLLLQTGDFKLINPSIYPVVQFGYRDFGEDTYLINSIGLDLKPDTSEGAILLGELNGEFVEQKESMPIMHMVLHPIGDSWPPTTPEIVHIYPNPVQHYDTLYIDFYAGSGSYAIEIWDLTTSTPSRTYLRSMGVWSEGIQKINTQIRNYNRGLHVVKLSKDGVQLHEMKFIVK